MIKRKLDLALEIAARVHLKQKRKGADIPYIVHPYSVMLLAATVTQNEDTLCACLLHDVIEDGDAREYSESDMVRDFGTEVTNTVKAVTKDEGIKGWRARNEAYLDTLRSSNNQAAYIVCVADKIHNITSCLIDVEELGDDLWSRFNAGKESQKWWYRAALTMLEEKIPNNPLVHELSRLVTQLERL